MKSMNKKKKKMMKKKPVPEVKIRLGMQAYA